MSTDAFAPSERSIERNLFDRANHSQIMKLFSHHGEQGRERYNPARFVSVATDAVTGMPDLDRATTSHVERKNRSLRQWCKRLTRLTYAYSKKWEHLHAELALHSRTTTSADSPVASRDTRDGVRHHRSRLDAPRAVAVGLQYAHSVRPQQQLRFRRRTAMLYRRHGSSASAFLFAVLVAFASYGAASSAQPDDFQRKRDQLIKRIDGLNARMDPEAPWRYTMKLVASGRTVQVTMTSRLRDEKPSKQEFTFPGPYTFESVKSPGASKDNMLALHGKEFWNIGAFKQDGTAGDLAQSLTELNKLCAASAKK